MSQLSLFRPNPRHTFDSFYSPTGSPASSVLTASEERACQLWVHGPSGCGKTHLLQAVCQRAEQHGHAAAYVPLSQLRELGPSALQGLEQCQWICLDEVTEVLCDAVWEQALFALFNQAHDHGTRLLFAAQVPPLQTQSALPDLASRLRGMLTVALGLLDDEQQIAALQLRARQQGYELSAEVVRYLQRHRTRGMAELSVLWDCLEAQATAAQRRITIPLVRKFFEQDAQPEG